MHQSKKLNISKQDVLFWAKLTFEKKIFGPRPPQFSGMTTPWLRFAQEHSDRLIRKKAMVSLTGLCQLFYIYNIFFYFGEMVPKGLTAQWRRKNISVKYYNIRQLEQ